jgi:para-aminobenzoate synthetase/4-amino-4-deoxychorismate lyase
MNTMNKGPLIYLDFNGKTLIFENPVVTFELENVQDIRKTLRIIQSYVDQGYYAAGYLSYESAAAFDPKYKVKESTSMPLLWFGIYKSVNYNCHIKNADNYYISEWETAVSSKDYYKNICHIKTEISKGNTYQVNYTIPMRANYHGNGFTHYKKLLRAQRANYGAYIDTGRFQILSVSPELFFECEERRIITRPMKGTIKRGKYYLEDQINYNFLRNSEKDKAENLMIVDLLRNDLSKISELGSVNVMKLFEIEKYPTVYQMTSSIEAKLKDKVSIEEIMEALFPCGSITGAPKIKTMEIINEIEKNSREIYCGTIGYIAPNRNAVFNVAIRTIWIDKEKNMSEYSVGGGITWDSTSQSEYQEAITKAAVLTEEVTDFKLYEQIKLNNGFTALEKYHLQRLQSSSNYFDYPFSISKIRQALKLEKNRYPNGEHVMNLYLDKYGEITSHTMTYEKPVINKLLTTVVASSPINSENKMIYHKTTDRTIYNNYTQEKSNCYDVLLWNEEGQLTQFTTGNIVVRKNGELLTPPVAAGIIPGVFREYLLDTEQIREANLEISELQSYEKIWLINNILGWVKLSLQ